MNNHNRGNTSHHLPPQDDHYFNSRSHSSNLRDASEDEKDESPVSVKGESKSIAEEERKNYIGNDSDNDSDILRKEIRFDDQHSHLSGQDNINRIGPDDDEQKEKLGR